MARVSLDAPFGGWVQRLSRAVLVLVLMVAFGALPAAPGASAARTNNNRTPQGVKASLFQPCEFELGDVSGKFSLKDLAESQHYDYEPLTNRAANLDSFGTLNASSKAGIIEIATHGSANRLLVECYQPTPAGQRARDTRLDRICRGVDRPVGVLLSCPSDVDRFSGGTPAAPTDYGIGLSPTGIRKLLPQVAHNIVFVGACFSWEVREGFVTTAIEYFGYTQACTREKHIAKDTTLLYRRLAGMEFDGKAREIGSGTAIFPNLPDGTCTAFGKGGYSSILRHEGPGNTTVAPIVAWVGVADSCHNGKEAFTPKDMAFPVPDEGLQIDGSVLFDTAMDTSKDPTKVLTTGRENDCQVALVQVRWASDKELSFKAVLRHPGEFHLVVHNELAVSFDNQRELDGNQVPHPFKDNGVGRNRDDYVARNRCVRTGSTSTTTSSTTTTTSSTTTTTTSTTTTTGSTTTTTGSTTTTTT